MLKEGKNLSIRFVFSEARLWRYLLKELSEYLDTLAIRVDPEKGVSIRAMDPSHVMLIELEAPPAAFEEFKADKSVDVILNLEQASKILRRASKSDKFLLTASETEVVLGFISKNGVERFFSLPSLSGSFEEVPELELDLKNRAKIVGSLFSNTISLLEKAGDVLSITAEENGIVISASSEMGELAFRFTTDEGTLTDYTPPEQPYTNHYTLEYITVAKNISKLCDIVDIGLSPEMPIELVMEFGGARIKMYVAPRSE